MNQKLTEQISQYLATQPVLKAWVFGSFARGEEKPDSDIDILVRFDRKNAKIGLFKYASMIIDLVNILHREVDLVEDGALLPYAERTANKDKKLIYERSAS
ncbi:MAG: nucleotidyltransferase family protein [Bacteroidales bacterium]|nr:nucleotidyltransferase family protein [Bacteroidales bacterium]